MNNNDILRRLRYTFEFSDQQMITLFAHGGEEPTRAQVSDWLKKEEDPAFQELSDRELATFLNGLIIDRRGKRTGPPPVPEQRLTNNLVLKKLKIALNFRHEEMLAVFEAAQLKLSVSELSALMRNPNQDKYRPCKDQYLRNFLMGLQQTYRPKADAS